MPSLLAPRQPLTPAPLVADRLSRPEVPPRYSLGFLLFLVVNAMLFVRPAEIVPALLGWQIYLVSILLCLALSFPAVLEQLQFRLLASQPISLCVLMLLPSIVLSHLGQGRPEEAVLEGLDFCKTLLYFLLFLGLVTTPGRLRTFVLCFVLFASVATALALLQFYDLIHLPNLNPLREGVDNAAAGTSSLLRLRGSGLFADPNDLCVLLSVSLVFTVYGLTDTRSVLLRLAMLGPLGIFCYAVALTHSRGGMLAVLGGLGAYLWARQGLSRSLLIGGALLPVLLALFAGRQTNIDIRGGTGQERIQQWREGLLMLRTYPHCGVGSNYFAKEAGLVAHNSYVHAFGELGLLGGVSYLGAFALTLWTFLRIRRGGHNILDPELRRMYPYLLGGAAAYMVGMLSLSLCYILSTYMILGIAGVFGQMVRTDPPLRPLRCDVHLGLILLALSIAFLFGIFVCVRLFAGG
jgi:hypothetical protein